MQQELETLQRLEKTRPCVWHVHLDTKTESLELHKQIQTKLGFFRHDFTGHPDGRIHFEPTSHSSIICCSKEEFDAKWKACEEIVSKDPEVRGYMEGEYIPSDEAIPFKPISAEVEFFKFPFDIKRRTLSSKLGEKFRETEFHLVMDWDNSDQRVIDSLLDAGLYGAMLEKEGWRAIVLTIQGHKRLLKPVMAAVKAYLHAIGGAARCTIKEELALRNKLFNYSVEELPEIIQSITHF